MLVDPALLRWRLSQLGRDWKPAAPHVNVLLKDFRPLHNPCPREVLTMRRECSALLAILQVLVATVAFAAFAGSEPRRGSSQPSGCCEPDYKRCEWEGLCFSEGYCLAGHKCSILEDLCSWNYETCPPTVE